MAWTRRAVIAGLAASGLAGCEEMAGLPDPAPPPAPLPETPPDHYAARRDGRFSIPAVRTDEIPGWLLRQVVVYPGTEPEGTIEVYSDARLLYHVLPDGWAVRYGISVGREGLGWTGNAEVYRTAHWPTWTPTPSMIERDPSLERWADGQAGGPSNPLGARALYMRTLATGADEGIRIHGTPEWRSIGRAASAGCFRMLQQDVIDLYGRAGRGTRVVVV